MATHRAARASRPRTVMRVSRQQQPISFRSTDRQVESDYRKTEETKMRKLITMSAIAALMVTGAVAQGHSRSQAAGSPGAAHSNAPAGIPAASRDRDHGKQRDRKSVV